MDQPDEPIETTPEQPQPEAGEPLAPESVGAPEAFGVQEPAEPAAGPMGEPGEPVERVEIPAVEAATPDAEAEAVPAPIVAEEKPTVDLNAASAAELSRLPGVSAALANRIVAYRAKHGPFKEPAEVMQVRGISKSLYARIGDLLTAQPPQPVPEVYVAPDVPVEEPAAAEAAPGGVAPVGMVPGRAHQGPPPLDFSEFEPQPSRPGWLGVLVIGLVGALLGAFLALAILAVINGTLQFGRAATIRTLTSDVRQFGTRTEQLGTDLQTAQVRLDRSQADLEAMGQQVRGMQGQLQTLGGDVAAAQTELKALRVDLNTMGGNVAALQTRASALETQLATLGEEVQTIRLAVDRFDAFLVGLRALLDETGPVVTPPPAVGTSIPLTPEPTPVITATMGPTATLP